MEDIFERRKGSAIFNLKRDYRVCAQCINDTSDPEITFDEQGVCNHCKEYDRVSARDVFRGVEGRDALAALVQQIKEEGKGKEYDCVVGLSGGVDSTYVAYLVKKEYGLRPLAVHLDNGWNSETAVRNIYNIVEKLDLHLHTEVLDWEEFRRLQLAFLRASTPDSEIPTDHAIVATMYWSALKHRVRWIVEGSNVVTEAMMPATWSHGHSDWKYIKYLNDHFGGAKLKTYPHYTDFDLVVRFPYIHKLRRLPILNYVDYDKKAAMATMKRELDWVSYGGKHYESIYTRFYQGYILKEKFGFDKRRAHYSCLVRSGQMTRAEALAEMEQPAIPPGMLAEDRAFVIKKLGIDEAEFEAIMRAERKTFWDYPSYERDHPSSPVTKGYRSATRSYLKARRAVRQTAKKGFEAVAAVGLYPGEVAPPDRAARPARAPKDKTLCIISLTPVTDEPRVRRQAAAFLDRGWKVVVVGFKGRSAKPERWALVEVEAQRSPAPKWERRLMPRYKKYARWVPTLAERYYWRAGSYASIWKQLEHIQCDLVLANDYYTAPLAQRLGVKNDAPFAIDCHEYARGQYMHDEKWVREERTWIDAVQKAFLPKALVVTTVCQGIAELLALDYKLERVPTVVRSTPPYQAMPFRPTGKTIEVLYHGILAEARGLEQAIQSVRRWRPEFRLIIRGHGPDPYVESLRTLIAAEGVAERVELVGPVPFDEMIPAANNSDIGYFAQPDLSPQKRFTLPNKFFEYIMAGMALCVSDLPEMARITQEHDLGRLVRAPDPEAIAEAINGFTRESIDAYKRRSLEAAETLCWEVESAGMMRAFAQLDPSFLEPLPLLAEAEEEGEAPVAVGAERLARKTATPTARPPRP